MTYISFIIAWEREFDNFVSERDKLQDLRFNQMKLEVSNTDKKHEKNNQF